MRAACMGMGCGPDMGTIPYHRSYSTITMKERERARERERDVQLQEGVCV